MSNLEKKYVRANIVLEVSFVTPFSDRLCMMIDHPEIVRIRAYVISLSD